MRDLVIEDVPVTVGRTRRTVRVQLGAESRGCRCGGRALEVGLRRWRPIVAVTDVITDEELSHELGPVGEAEIVAALATVPRVGV